MARADPWTAPEGCTRRYYRQKLRIAAAVIASALVLFQYFGLLGQSTFATQHVLDEPFFEETPKPVDEASSRTHKYAHGPRDRVIPYPKLRFSERDRASLSAKRVIHLLSHTHWDREWYLSVEEFRGSLIIELDRVIEMLTNSSAEFHHFHMDGQYLMVEDYLEARPSARETLADLNRRGKITLGPFYSSPDVFLASGEALIRNLMIGMALSSDMGGTSQVGYMPDSFGFIGQMPQLLLGFGIKYFVSGRFANKRSSEGIWVGPDGSEVLYAFLGNWYCHAIGNGKLMQPSSASHAHSMLMALDNDLESQGAQSKHRLAMYGCDHFMTDPDVGITVKSINDMASSEMIQLVQTNVDDYMALLQSDIEERAVKLPTVEGEVREGVDMLINSASTKMSVKQMNFKVQTLLERWVEPMEAYGWALSGRRYDSDRIWHAWKFVLQTHAHDSICATSSSTVIHDIVNRLSRAEQAAYRIIADQAGQVIPALARKLSHAVGTGSMNADMVILINPTNTPRSECITFTLRSDSPTIGRFTGIKNLIDGDKSAVQPIFLVAQSDSSETFELPNKHFRKHLHKGSATYMARVSLPPNGVALLQLVSRDESSAHPSISKPPIAEAPTGSMSLENEYMHVEIHANDGSCSLTHQESGHSWQGLNKLWRTTEQGTSYQHREGLDQQQPVMHIVSRKESVAFSSIQLEGTLGMSKLSITYVLFAGARSVQIQTTVQNAERNNYVVTSFPVRRSTGDTIDIVSVDVDGNFEYVDRTKMTNRYVHQNRFVSVYSAESSLTVSVRGIPEYIVGNLHGADSLEMTLIRGVNKIGDWIAGPLTDDISQELTEMTFQYTVIPDTCRVTEASCTADIEARNFVDPIGSFASWVDDGYRPERYIDMDMSPLSVVAGLPSVGHGDSNSQLDVLPVTSLGSKQMFHLTPAKLILSTVKKAESQDAVIVRFYNPTAATLQASILPGLVKFSAVKFVLLNENEAGKDEDIMSPHDDGGFRFTVAPHKIVTMALIE